MFYPIGINAEFLDRIDRQIAAAEGHPTAEPGGCYLDMSFEAYRARSIASYSFMFENIEKIMALNNGKGIGIEI